MKSIIKMALTAALPLLALTSCNSYLDEAPKGKKIPTTLTDFEAMLRNEYSNCYTPCDNALYLINDYQVNNSRLNSTTLMSALYLWDENADRIALNASDESCFYRNYSTISTSNLLLENVPNSTECTQAQRDEVMAYARVRRAASYWNLVNYYADAYTPETAATKLGVPIITSAVINAPYKQETVAKVYDFILADLDAAINGGLPMQSMTVLHPDLGTAHALKARVLLSMMRYPEALKEADLALTANDKLFDWNAFYDANQAAIQDPTNYTALPSQETFDYVENYYFCHGDGSANYGTKDLNLPQSRAERVEDGDARFAVRWKLRTVGADTYYQGMTSGFHNWAGITTVEVYLIKAECQARAGLLDEAMATLSRVRQTRIRPDMYQPSTASTLKEAIEKIRFSKDVEMLCTLVPFADAKRFNAEGTYARTMTKTWNGKTYTLRPDSHLWTMVFPGGAINNAGNGTLTQNSH